MLRMFSPTSIVNREMAYTVQSKTIFVLYISFLAREVPFLSEFTQWYQSQVAVINPSASSLKEASSPKMMEY